MPMQAAERGDEPGEGGEEAALAGLQRQLVHRPQDERQSSSLGTPRAPRQFVPVTLFHLHPGPQVLA